MKLAFIPGHLYLKKIGDDYVVESNGVEILRTRSRSHALKTFHDSRTQMEVEFPPQVSSDEERAESLRRALGDSLVKNNSFAGPKKKNPARGTRTFG